MTERRERRDPAARDGLEPGLEDADVLADGELGSARDALGDSADVPIDEGRGHNEVERLVQAMKKLRTAARNLAALQHGHQQMEQRVDELERAAAQRGETLARLREHLHERETELVELRTEVERLQRWSGEAPQASTREPLAPELAPELVEAHLLFVPDGAGYVLKEHPGPPLQPGETVVFGDARIRFVVTKVGSSPLPGDRRRCSYLLQTASQPTG